MPKTAAPARRSNWGTVTKERSGMFRALYTGPDGERHKAPHTFSTKTDARAWLATQQAAISNGTWRSPQAIEAEHRAREAATFGIYAENYLQTKLNRDGERLATKTANEYRRQLGNGLAEFAQLPISSITPAMVRGWHTHRLLSGATQAGRESALLRAIMNMAIRDDLITRNPVDSSLVASKSGLERDTMTSDELGIIMRTIGDRFYLAVIMGAFGGLRNSEWRALRRGDIELTFDDDGNALAALVKIERQALHHAGQGWEVAPPKSKNGVRVISLPQWAAADVAKHLSERVGAFPDSLLFPADHAEFVSDSEFRKAWNPAKAAAGITGNVTPYSLRHYAGTTYAATHPVAKDLQAFLGHTSWAATQNYLHKSGNDQAIANKMPKPDTTARTNITQLRDADAAAS